MMEPISKEQSLKGKNTESCQGKEAYPFCHIDIFILKLKLLSKTQRVVIIR